MIFLALVGSFYLAGFWLLSNAIATRNWRESSNDLHVLCEQHDEDLPCLAVVIPVLREQDVIVATLESFRLWDWPSSRFRVVIVTAESEETSRDDALVELAQRPDLLRFSSDRIASLFPGLGPPSIVIPVIEQIKSGAIAISDAAAHLPSTQALVKDWILQTGEHRFKVVHYPYLANSMATQVNYAVRYLFEAFDHGIVPDDTYIAIYNADSRPAVSTVSELKHWLSKENVVRRPVLLQQYSVYQARQRSGKSWIELIIADAASIWQTRWSVTVEIPRARRCLKFLSREIPLSLAPFAYTVGHGMIISMSHFVKAGYFPTTVKNEDQAFGYLSLLLDVVPQPLKSFDHCETARSSSQLFAQQAFWFNGPADALKYRQLAEIRRYATSAERSILAAKVLCDAVLWIMGPVICIVVILILIATDGQVRGSMFFLASFGMGVYFFLPCWSVRELLGLSGARFVLGLTGLPIFYAIHGIAALTAAAKRLSGFTGEWDYKAER